MSGPDISRAEGIAIALGGAAGAMLRALTAGIDAGYDPATGLAGAPLAFPMATFAVNLIGSFVIGFVAALPATAITAQWRAGMMAGLCGSFTTFSLLSLETLALITQGQWLLAALYVGATIAGSIAAAAAGFALGRPAGGSR